MKIKIIAATLYLLIATTGQSEPTLNVDYNKGFCVDIGTELHSQRFGSCTLKL